MAVSAEKLREVSDLWRAFGRTVDATARNIRHDPDSFGDPWQPNSARAQTVLLRREFEETAEKVLDILYRQP